MKTTASPSSSLLLFFSFSRPIWLLTIGPLRCHIHSVSSAQFTSPACMHVIQVLQFSFPSSSFFHTSGNPEWNHTLSLDLTEILSSLPHDAYDRVFVRFHLFHEGIMFGDKRIGEVHVALSEVIQPEGRGSIRFVSYQVKNPEGKPNGVLTFSYKFEGELDCDSIGGNGFAAIAGFPIVHPVEETSGSSGSASSSGMNYPKIDLEEHVVQETSYYPPPGTRYHPPKAPPSLGYPMPPPPLMQTAAVGGCYYPGVQPMPAFGQWHHHGYRHHCSTRGGGGGWRM